MGNDNPHDDLIQSENRRDRIKRLEEQNDRLTEQVNELERKVDEGSEAEDFTISRRQALGGIMAGGAFLGGSGTVGAFSGDTDSAPFSDKDHDHSGDYLGEGEPVRRIDTVDVYTNDLYNLQGKEAAIQTMWDGMVVPVAPGLGPSDAVDPSKTDTPVQDAIDTVYQTNAEVGRVILPAEPIQEATTIEMRAGIQLLGQGVGTFDRMGSGPKRASQIQIQEKGVDLLLFDDGVMQHNRLDGFELLGPSDPGAKNGATNTGAGLHIKSRMTRCTIGDIKFTNLSDAAIWAERDLIECNFGLVSAVGVDAAASGRALFDFQHTGYSNNIDVLAGYASDRSSGTDSDALHVAGFGDLSVNVLNIGGSLARGIMVEGDDGWLTVGGMNYEPHSQTESHVVVESRGSRGFEIGPAIIRGGADIERYCLLHSPSNNSIGPYKLNKSASKLNNRGIAIEGNTGGTNVVYQPSTDVANIYGVDLSTPVACLGDLTLFTDDGQEDEIPGYRVRKQTLTIDGDVSELSKSESLTLANNFSAWTGTYTDSGTVWLRWDEENLYLAADLVDDDHVQIHDATKLWHDDCIQLGVTSGYPGTADEWDQLDIGLTSDGPRVYRRVLPEKSISREMTAANASIVRSNGHTVYEVALPWSELTASASDDVLGLSMAIHDRDDNHETNTGWLEWGGGILGGKNNTVYKPAKLVD